MRFFYFESPVLIRMPKTGIKVDLKRIFQRAPITRQVDTLQDLVTPALWLFPAFFRTIGSDRMVWSILIRNGIVMLRESPPSLMALSEEHKVS